MLSCTSSSSFLLPHLIHLNLFFFFFNDTATTEIYTLSLHDALPILSHPRARAQVAHDALLAFRPPCDADRSEEHTSELQSPCNLVCRLLLEKKKNKTTSVTAQAV